MNIWDSVQRGLEKATQEATRRARTQRLRSTIDTLTQQIHTQEDELLIRIMEIFTAGNLTQSELLPLCQALINLQQQLEQAQHELSMVQSQPSQPATTIPVTPTQPSGYTPPVPPSSYGAYDPTMPAPPPPPPPGVTEVSAFNTVLIGTPGAESQRCTHCQVELIPGNAYCHNCGAPVDAKGIALQPTTLVDPSAEAKHDNPSPAQLSASNEQQAENLPTVEINEHDTPTRLEEHDER